MAGRKKGTPKTGGRRQGSQNKLTLSVKQAVLQVFDDLQDETGGAVGHLFAWAKEHPTEFYRICAKMIPQAISGSFEHDYRHGNTHESISETGKWIEELLGDEQNKPPKKLDS